MYAAGGEWIAINVRQIVRDLTIGPGEFELRHGSSARGIWRQLDGNADTRLRVRLRIRTLERPHTGMVILADGSIVDGVSTVIDHDRCPERPGRGQQGKEETAFMVSAHSLIYFIVRECNWIVLCTDSLWAETSSGVKSVFTRLVGK